MPTFKIKGIAIEDLPELEIEAQNEEEAKNKYEEKYFNDEIESDGITIEFLDEEAD